MTTVAQPVLMAKSLPRNIQPRTSRRIFAQDEKAEADRGVSFATRAAPPVTPPKTKLLGNLKKYTPMVMMLILRVMIYLHRLDLQGLFPRADLHLTVSFRRPRGTLFLHEGPFLCPLLVLL